jgi:hypothetical protein
MNSYQKLDLDKAGITQQGTTINLSPLEINQ